MVTNNIETLLQNNSYPGRGIILGRTPDNTKAMIAYWIMGRSSNSRNRVFTKTEDGIQTEAYDPSLLEDPSLIIYHPVRLYDGKTIVTNGDQTDTIWNGYKNGASFRASLQTREFEPDHPNYTPRISGVVMPNGSYKLSILKSFNGNPECCCRYFYDYSSPIAGLGHYIHTYMGDGNPLPSFEGEPELIEIDTNCGKEFAEKLWTNLNAENKVSLYVRTIDLETSEFKDIIFNKNEG